MAGSPLPVAGNRRLRQLATAALRPYGVTAAHLTLLSAKEHPIFRVDLPPIDGASPRVRRFALRLYHPDAYDAAGVVSELAWLAALRRDTVLAVPEPVPAPDGALLVALDEAAAGEPRHAVLCRWVSGRRRRASLTPAALEAVGRFVGELHRHSARFVPPADAPARRWDWARVFGGDSPVGPASDDPLLNPDQRRAFGQVATLVRAALDALGTSPEAFGMIHGDLHTANYLFDRGIVGAIDFEDCGVGHHLYDLAVILDELIARHPDREPTLRAALLHGYRAVRPLPAAHEALLDILIAMRLAELTRWYASAPDPPERGNYAPPRHPPPCRGITDLIFPEYYHWDMSHFLSSPRAASASSAGSPALRLGVLGDLLGVMAVQSYTRPSARIPARMEAAR